MKICKGCNQEKNLSEFNFRNREKGTYSSDCKICKRKIDNDLYKSNRTDRKRKVSSVRKNKINENREIIKNIKLNSECYLCGDKRHYVLDFHHLVSEDKDNDISLLVRRASSIDRIMKEIEKCVLLCSNCHRELHFLNKEDELSEKVKCTRSLA